MQRGVLSHHPPVTKGWSRLQRRPSSSGSLGAMRLVPRARVSPGGVCVVAAAILWAGHSAADVIEINETLLTLDHSTNRDARASEGKTAFVTDRTGTRDVFVLDKSTGLLSIT